MLGIHKEIGFLFNDRRIIHSLHKNQVAVIKSGPSSEETTARKGVRQGCALSPVIFNVYIEKAINEIKEKPSGVNIHGGKVSMLRFANDTVLIAETERYLKNIKGNTRMTGVGRIPILTASGQLTVRPFHALFHSFSLHIFT